MPTTKSTLLLFIALLAQSNFAHTTIKAYLSTVHSLHTQSGLLHLFSTQLTPCVETVLRGIKKEQSERQPPRIRLPITIDIMYRLKQVLQEHPKDYHNLMMWAACCIAFFSFLCCSEFAGALKLTYNDVTVDC